MALWTTPGAQCPSNTSDVHPSQLHPLRRQANGYSGIVYHVSNWVSHPNSTLSLASPHLHSSYRNLKTHNNVQDDRCARSKTALASHKDPLSELTLGGRAMMQPRLHCAAVGSGNWVKLILIICRAIGMREKSGIVGGEHRLC
eukprot:2916948-Amphidinium_carterae.1